MRFKAFICDVLAKEFYNLRTFSKHKIDIELIDSKDHEHPLKIKKILQNKINNLENYGLKYNYILLGYGVCGKILDGIKSNSIPIVVPKAHDCIALLMGSKEKYAVCFRDNPGIMYYIHSWIEKNGLKKERQELESIGLGNSFEEYVKKFGEENANYLLELADGWKSRYNKAVYMSSVLDNVLSRIDYSEQVKEIANIRNWSYEKMIGDPSLLMHMVCGTWDKNSFLIVKKNSIIYQTYDENIICSKKVRKKDACENIV